MKRMIVTSIAVLLAILFIYAAVNKLIIFNTFIQQLQKSPITNRFEYILSWLVPLTELSISALLLIPKTRLKGLYSAFFLMLIFTVYIYVLPHFFRNPGCSCGGIISTFSWKEHFWFNTFFTLLAGIGISLYDTRNINDIPNTTKAIA